MIKVPSKNSDVQSGDERIGGPAWCPVAFLTVFFFFFIQHRRLVKHASGQASRVGTVLVTPDGSSWVDVIPASRRSETPAADLRGPRHPWSYSRLIRLACLPRDQSLTMLHQIEGEEFGSQVVTNNIQTDTINSTGNPVSTNSFGNESTNKFGLKNTSDVF
ncbi:hypothetical protein OPV22_002751 [Ensete ventricosum]|uniref:Uncharacterized protein n=1 Tax=Ensete ventricosum TaxID=4639 RepID=A0AAV8RYX8_ENSVE|nr:hypothetical protein OPV22_002751 [Ensete ventricosum]